MSKRRSLNQLRGRIQSTKKLPLRPKMTKRQRKKAMKEQEKFNPWRVPKIPNRPRGPRESYDDSSPRAKRIRSAMDDLMITKDEIQRMRNKKAFAKRH